MILKHYSKTVPQITTIMSLTVKSHKYFLEKFGQKKASRIM
jgi:hypothetical protein